MTSVLFNRLSRQRGPIGVWVDAAPFRAHVIRLMAQTGLPWAAIAYQARVPLNTCRTLVIGRDGHLRSRIPRDYALRLITLAPGQLYWLTHTEVDAGPAASRLRLLRAHGRSWQELSDLTGTAITTLTAIAHGELDQCSSKIDVLVQLDCQSLDLRPWDLRQLEVSAPGD
ncbi:MAG: hypothetical protein LBV30_06840 [Propionibacteriaceae bacterium]|jgi:hypothetical protein|nr:hypothetical protein [Propionibacteriaceae bacterium]